MPDVTLILSQIESGDPQAAKQLLPLVYDELKTLAAQRMAQEKPGQTLQATALVHEAYVRLVDVERGQQFNSRGHFFAAAAEAMRRILVENARRKRGPKAGGWHLRVELSNVSVEIQRPDVDLIVLSELGQLASAGADRMIHIWDATTGQQIRQLDGHSDEVVCVTYSPDGKWLASASWDRTVRLWDTATGRLVHTFHGHVSWGQKIRFSPDSKWLAAAGVNRSILLWDTAGQLVRTLEGHAGDVVCIAFCPDNTRLASASWDHTVKIWDLPWGQEVLTLKGHTGPVYDLAFSADDSSLASAGDDHTVKVWDTRPWREKQVNAIGKKRTGVCYALPLQP